MEITATTTIVIRDSIGREVLNMSTTIETHEGDNPRFARAACELAVDNAKGRLLDAVTAAIPGASKVASDRPV